MKERIFVTGNGNSVYMFQYIKQMCFEKYQVTLLDNSMKTERVEFYDYYNENDVVVIRLKTGIITKALYIKMLGEFDICHVMFADAVTCKMIGLCRENFKKIIVNFWGSDFYRTTIEQQKIQEYLLEIADAVIVPIEKMEKPLISRWPQLEQRVRTVCFGSELYNMLKTRGICNQPNKEEKFLDKIDKNKTWIVVGHSGDPNDQQEMVCRALEACREITMFPVVVILPMTYGLSAEYEERIRELLKQMPYESVILTEYMSLEQMCILRQNTDIYVQSLTTDAFGYALRENMQSQSIILCGAWLDYPQLKENDNGIVWFSDEKDLSEKFAEIITNIDFYRSEAVKNKKCIDYLDAKIKDNQNWSDYYQGDSLLDEKREKWQYREAIVETIKSRDRLDNRLGLLWLSRKQNSENPICDYMENREYHNVLLYGAGLFGELVLREIQNHFTVTICDQDSKKRVWYSGSIQKPEELEDSYFDCIIITPIYYVDEIKKTLYEKSIRGKSIISISDILGEEGERTL